MQASFGGAAFLNSVAFAAVYCSIVANEASTGGGIYSQLSLLRLTSILLSKNNATKGGGGGLYIGLSSVLYLNLSSLSYNNALRSPGGGLFLDNSKAELRLVQIVDNNANGALVSVTKGACSAVGGCISTPEYGKGPYPQGECTFVVAKEGVLIVTSFDLFTADSLNINGEEKYTGFDGPNGVTVSAGDSIGFDGSSARGNAGFLICLDVPPSSGTLSYCEHHDLFSLNFVLRRRRLSFEL